MGKKIFISLFFSILFNSFFFAQNTNVDKNNIALKGYDVVSYFYLEKPVKGTAEIVYEYKGTKYLFANKVYHRLFRTEPKKYIPQYGGWCAYGIAKGKKSPINPNAYIISDNKLYLFYKTPFLDTKKLWEKDSVSLQKNADIAWKKFNK